MKPFLLATRPKTLIASISPILIGTSMAYAGGHFSLWIGLFTLLTGMGIQISCNFANDLFDFLKGADTQERKGPIRVTASGLLTASRMKLLTFLTMGLTALSGCVLAYRGGLAIALLVALALLLALGYTTGPLPLAYLGLGECFVLIFFGPIATGFTYYLQTLQFHLAPFTAGIAPGLISCAILVINNLRDVDEDRQTGKNTLAVRLGAQFGKWEFSLCMILACAIPFFASGKHLLSQVSALTVVPALFLCREVFTVRDPLEYNPLFGKTGQLLTLYTASFCIGFLI